MMSNVTFPVGNRFKADVPPELVVLLNQILSLPSWQYTLLRELLDYLFDPEGS